MKPQRLFFGAATDPSKYYPAIGHEDVYCKILAGLRDGEPLQVVVGKRGSGKTTLAMRWLSEIGNQFDTIFLPARVYGESILLLRDINNELCLPASSNRWTLKEQIKEKLLAGYEKNINSLFIVDGGHQISDESLQDLLEFSNLIGSKGNVLSIVILGDFNLLDKLTGHSRINNTKIAFPIHLIPQLEDNELADFARQQIRLEGLDPDQIIDHETLNSVVSLAKGNIARIITLLRLSWRFAKIHEMKCIDMELVESAHNSITCLHNDYIEGMEPQEFVIQTQGISA